MKVLVFIDHDIICRHFIMNGALAPLAKSADVRFVFPDDGKKRVKLDVEKLPLNAPFELLPVDPHRQQTWRWLLYADQLKIRGGAHERAIRRIRRATLGWKAATLLTLGGLPVGSTIFRRVAARRLSRHSNAALCALLDRERPDIVLHPSVLDGVFINDLVVECRARGTALVVAINSWDNPSSKRAVVGRPDRMLVWGAQTQRHAMRFMNMSSDEVVRFGAPQFDVFRDPPRVDRNQFCAEHGIDPSRSIVLFAGSNARTDEVAALDALDAAIESGSAGKITVVYRPHPWGGGGKGGARLANASWRHIVIDRSIRPYLSNIASDRARINLPDYRDTHDLLSAVDAVISPLSTILLEGALHGKPIVAFLPEDSAETLATMIPLLHFEEFFALKDVTVVKSLPALIATLPALVSNAEAQGARLKAAADQFVEPFARPWRERIVDFLEDLVRPDANKTDRVAAE